MINNRSFPLSLTILCLALLFAFCKSATNKNQTAHPSIKDKTKTQMPMPPLPLAGDDADDWKIVDSLEKQGLYKSALEKTEAIQQRARNERNAPQSIKALLFRGKYTTMLDEDGFVKAVQMFETEEKTAQPAEKAVLQSILGQLYTTYLQNQAWKIQERTPIPDGEGGDMLTWSAAQIERRALDMYMASVERRPILLETNVESFRDILTENQNDSVGGLPLRPSLYDLLAHRALSAFVNDRSYLTEPAYKFEISDPLAFAPLDQFLKAGFDTQDSTSGKWLALKTFQQVLTTTNRPSKNTPALIDADLLRLQFVSNNFVGEDKDNLHLRALENLHKQYADEPSDAEITYQIALYWSSLQTGDKGENAKRAVAECEDAIRRHPGTFGAQQCSNLLESTRAQSLNIQTEEAYLPNKNMLVSLVVRNLPTVWVKVVQVPDDPDLWNNIPYEQRLNYLNKLEGMQNRTWELQDPHDYQTHRTEIGLEPLPVGNYWVLIASNIGFDPKKGPVAFANFNCSNLSAVQYDQEGTTRFILANRLSGAPMPGTKLEFFVREYQNNRNKLVATAITDAGGIAAATLAKNTYGSVRASFAGDTLWVGQAQNYRYDRPEASGRQVQFFTDRALYRPGQTVYFKGILFKPKTDGQPQIVPNQAVTVKFLDANQQEKGQLKLRSNEFGTFNGAFAAPSSGLTGSMSIQLTDASGQASFNVEEYKRPKFEVTFKPVEGAFKLEETVTVRGEAKAYAGSNVDGAQVHYRVVRQARFPFYDFGWGRKMFPPWRTDAMEITSGNVTTDANGGFEVKFTAIPDRSIPKKEQPVFDYTVYADVTDLNGETRSSQQGVSVGYLGLQVELGLTNDIELDSLRRIAIKTSNLAGQPQPASGEITLQRLVEPKTFFINRYWERPDLAAIPKANFAVMFPDYAWKDEDDPEKWDRQDQLITYSFNTANDKTIDLNGGKVQPGYYYLRLKTKDAFGQDVEIKKVIRVWDKNNRATQFVEPQAQAEKTTLQPGETARIWLGGKSAPLNFFFARERDGKLDNPSWLQVTGAAPVEIPITESDRGGVSATVFTVKNNRVYTMPIALNVPWSNKELNITYETFRDKLAPGQQEEWRIKISGPKKEKVAAEMVAAMYDASLDQFLPHNWEQIYYPNRYAQIGLNPRTFGPAYGEVRYEPAAGTTTPSRVYHDLNLFDFPLYGGRYYLSRNGSYDEVAVMSAPAGAGGAPKQQRMEKKRDGAFDKETGESADTAVLEDVSGAGKPVPPPPPPPGSIRTNLQETVFFFPELRTDAEGNVIVKFKMNEALTRWKFLAFAHTKDLQQAVSMKEVVTQKELMVLANAPRFLREGDDMEFSAKVSNLSQEALSGTATLTLLDANTLQPVDADFGIGGAAKTATFQIQPGQSAPLAWKIKVPIGKVNGLTWQIYADGKKFRDGEESTIPVVTNRMLVTETLPITVRGGQTKTFTFDNIKNNPSNTLTSERYTLEFTSNPVWYAVQSLPYLMEFPHECSEQIFSRFYANTLASSVTQRLPNIRKVYDRWKGTGAMKSNLSKNQELKTALLEETPWVLDAQSEEQQKQNIALLFDLNRMADEQERALNILAERQRGDGSWPWFPGGSGDWYITQYLAEGFGHLQQLGAFDAKKDQNSQQMLDKALAFCDAKIIGQYNELEKLVQAGKAKWEDDHLDGLVIHYLYTKSFFKIDRPNKEYAYYLDQAGKYWLGKGLYQEGMLALALHRAGRPEAAAKIVASLRERATMKEELGMYWPNNWGFYWYQLPVETQALMVEVFSEVAKDPKAVEELRIWLLKNKQTNRWESTKATAEAVYALLLGTGQPTADSWLNNTQTVQVSLGGKNLNPKEIEPGTGYFKQAWNGADVQKNWSEIKVENPNSNIVWGAAYWQYFEDLDKIKSFQKTPLTIVKQLYKVTDSPTGPVLTALAEGAKLKPGDRLKVRIEIRVDREMEYVHLKDMRAAGFEPTNVLSQYKWQGGLGYYESTKDLATHFFIDYLPKGTFVFEYPLVVSHRGNMSNGITTMQCMYAPEFTSHSMGIRVNVE